MARKIHILEDMGEVKKGAVGVHEPRGHWWIFQKKDVPACPAGHLPWLDDTYQDHEEFAGKFRIEEEGVTH